MQSKLKTCIERNNTFFLQDKKFWKIFQYHKMVFPDSRSIGYDVPIYIIQNENIYSAAGTLAAYAACSENIFSVGNPTGIWLGKGVDPIIFDLPNSHILLRLEPVIDISNADNAKKCFMTKLRYCLNINQPFWARVYGKQFKP